MDTNVNQKNLLPYEIFQLEKYGNILPGSDSEDEVTEETLSTSEINYIFSSQNESHEISSN